MSYFGGGANSLAFPSFNPPRSFQSQPIPSNSDTTTLTQSTNSHSNEQAQAQNPSQPLRYEHLVKLLQRSDLSQPGINNTIRVSKSERKNRPGQKFGAKKKSWVWTWFVQDVQDPNVAACDFCGKIITRLASDKGSPKKLSEHLKTHKLNRGSINNSRPIPVDGNGTTYVPNGLSLGYANTNNFPAQSLALEGPTKSLATSPSSIDHGKNGHMPLRKEAYNHRNIDHLGQPQHQPLQFHPSSHTHHQLQQQLLDLAHRDSNATKHTASPNPHNVDFSTSRRFISTDFDNAPYTTMKFQKHLMKFLIENKLSISVIKSHSFQQLVYDLRSDSVAELLELTGLCSSLLEVSRFDSHTLNHNKSDLGHSASSSSSSINTGVRRNSDHVDNVVNLLGPLVEKNL